MSRERAILANLRTKIINHLRYEWRSWDGSAWISFADLVSELKANVRSVKRVVRALSREGVVRLDYLFDEDGMVCGRGYLLTPQWDVHKPGRANDPEWREDCR